MPYPAEDSVAQLRDARRLFLRQLAGMTDEQWGLKPYPECKSALETPARLISDDRVALDCIRTGVAPDCDAYDEPVTDRPSLLASEDCCRAGQMAYIRMTTYPTWD